MAIHTHTAAEVACHCLECQKTFVTGAAQVARGRGKYCSRTCGVRHARRVRWQAEKQTLEQRYWKHVVRRGDDECWAWTAFKHKGYGRLNDGGTVIGAHRVSYMIHHGEIANGQTVLHRCDNPECTNPRHLFLGSNADNNRDRDAKGRQARGDRAGQAKLSNKDVLRLRAAHRAGKNISSFAEKLGVSESAVRAAARGHTWRHLP